MSHIHTSAQDASEYTAKFAAMLVSPAFPFDEEEEEEEKLSERSDS